MRHNEKGFVELILLAVVVVVASTFAVFQHNNNEHGRHDGAKHHKPPVDGGPVQPIPEPSSILLFGVGAAVLGGYIYKVKK